MVLREAAACGENPTEQSASGSLKTDGKHTGFACLLHMCHECRPALPRRGCLGAMGCFHCRLVYKINQVKSGSPRGSDQRIMDLRDWSKNCDSWS